MAEYNFDGLSDLDKQTPGYDFSGLGDDQPKTVGKAIAKKVEKIQDSTASAVKAVNKSLKEDASDTLHGFTEGALLGGSDETGGMIYALLDKLNRGANNLGLAKPSPSQVDEKLKAQGFTGDIGPTDFGGMYREGQQRTKKDFDKAEERSPYLYTGGQLAGGITTSLPIGGALTTGLTKAGVLAKVAPTLAEDASLLTKLGHYGSKAGRLATLAAPEGAAMGALSSEKGKLIDATPEEQQKLLADTAGGLITGSVLGGGISLASDLVPMAAKAVSKPIKDKLAKITDDSPLLRQMKLAYDKGGEGLSLSSEKHELVGEPGKFAPLSQLETNASQDLVNRINSADEMLGQHVGQSLEQASQQGIKIDVTDDAAKVAKDIQNFALKNSDVFGDTASFKTMEKMFPGKGVLSPMDAKATINELDGILDKMAGDTNLKTNVLRDHALRLRKMIDNQLKAQVPQYKQAATRFEEFRRLVPETVLRGRTSEGFNDIMYGGLKNPEKKLQSGLTELIAGATRPGTATSKSKEVFSNLGQSINQLEKSEGQRVAQGLVKPDETVFSKMGVNKPSEFMDIVKQHADESAMKTQAKGVNPNEGLSTTFQRGAVGFANAGRGFAMNVANKAGQAASTVASVAKKTSPVNLAKKVFSMAPHELQGLSQDLINNPSTTTLGQALQDAVNSNDMAKQNAILFSIMQNPKIRLGITADDVEGDDK